MKFTNPEVATADKISQQIENDSETNAGLVIPVILWWLGAPITLLVLLWFFGIL